MRKSLTQNLKNELLEGTAENANRNVIVITVNAILSLLRSLIINLIDSMSDDYNNKLKLKS